MEIIKQNGKNDCLFACLKMILAYFNKDRNYLFIPSKKETKYSLLEIQNIAKEYQMNLEGVEYSEKQLILENVNQPFIALIKQGNNNHAIIVEKVKKDTIYIVDPRYGKMKINQNEFIESFSGITLMVKDYKKQKCTVKKMNFFKESETWCLLAFQIISGVSALLGTYYVNKEVPFYIPIILFAAFVIFEIISKKYAMVLLKKADDRVLYSYEIDSNYDEYYYNYTKVKGGVLLGELNINSSLIILAFSFIILVINGWLNLVYFLVGIISSLIYQLLKLKFSDPLTIHNTKLESQLSKCKDFDDFIYKAKYINENSYKVGLNYRLFECIGLGMIIFTTVLMMALTDNVSINYLLFNIVFTILIYKSSNTTIEYSIPNVDLDTSLCYVINKIK